MQLENSNKILAQERKLKAEIMDLRSENAVLEDKLSQVRLPQYWLHTALSFPKSVPQAKEELLSAAANIQKLHNLNTQLEVSRNSAIEGMRLRLPDCFPAAIFFYNILYFSAGQTRLRSDLKNMQQSIQASYRLETSQGIPLTSDPTTAIKLNDAKNEAKTRQLMNKVDNADASVLNLPTI